MDPVAFEPRLLDYLNDFAAAREHPAAARLRERTRALPDARMQISIDEGRFLAWLVASIGARRAIEVGVFTGYSALWVALQLPPDGRLVACDVSEEWTSIGVPFWREAGVAERIDLRLGPAADTLRALLDAGEAGSHDFAFIDADKEGYGEYYELCLELVRQGGVLAFDNMFLGGRVLAPAADDSTARGLVALTELIRTDPRVDALLLPIRDGVLVARKRAGRRG